MISGTTEKASRWSLNNIKSTTREHAYVPKFAAFFCRSIHIKLTFNAFAQTLPASTASRHRISAYLTFQPRLEAPTKGKNKNPGNELLYGHARAVEDICQVPLICSTVVYLVES